MKKDFGRRLRTPDRHSEILGDQKTQLTVQEAGRLGGLTTLNLHGKAHFAEAGKKGQKTLAAKSDTTQRRLWGAMGGRPQRLPYPLGGERNQDKGGNGSPPGI